MAMYYLGVDVGTGSARVAVMDNHGAVKGLSVEAIETHHPVSDIYEQSTDNIWASIVKATHQAMAQAHTTPDAIKGIGFDATCSLAVLDRYGQPLSVNQASDFQDHHWNVILWADHRAVDQASRINATGHPVLRYVGNAISPEMEIPKTLWLKENVPPAHWQAIGDLMDLPDYLTFRATGQRHRSACSLVCKCSYTPSPDRPQGAWDPTFFHAIGLACMADDHCLLGGDPQDEQQQVLLAGDRVEQGLSERAAEELGLLPGTPVGSPVIDAYAGAIATLGAGASSTQDLSHRLAIICGTSSCHIALSPEPIFVQGVWGPYPSVMLPGLWCAEGGQSSTGQLIDHVLATHPAIEQARQLAQAQHCDIYTFLNAHIASLTQKLNLVHWSLLTRQVHVYPDFHGNRSPLADPARRGTIVGLTLDTSVDDLALHYLATLQALACQTKHILTALNDQGYTINTLCLSGGLCKNPLFVQCHADITGCPVILPESIDAAVVLGAAILGARAAHQQDLWQVMCQLGKPGATLHPTTDPQLVHYHQQRYRVFLELLADQKKYDTIMAISSP
ncbi:Pentulose kinase [Hesseltinella vesiculosa]|uniref:Pentulose kinase n=1 Tax=Hesseltinella vesiculosa TaxID=101127 RepID=A0A1X2G427_9FUNG|nr:Pentulose kinase [Hesseltinella vesiculosa]